MTAISAGVFFTIAVMTALQETDPVVSYPVIGGSLLATAFLLVKLYKSVIRPLVAQVTRQEQEITRSALRHRVTSWRYSKLQEYAREQGLAIPDAILYNDPPWLAAELEKEKA